MKSPLLSLVIVTIVLLRGQAYGTESRPHNIVLFVADGLRAGMVNEKNAPTMAALMARGVRFTNTHSLFPTFTTANASGMATGHMLGDTGDFSNTIYTGFPVPARRRQPDAVPRERPGARRRRRAFRRRLPERGDHPEGRARRRLSRPPTIGKLGPALIFDHTERTGQKTIVVDDIDRPRRRHPAVRRDRRSASAAASLPRAGADARRQRQGRHQHDARARLRRQRRAAEPTSPTSRPRPCCRCSRSADKPFVMVFWSRDPDGTQHNQGDSLGRLVPGINGPTSLAAIRNADDNLAKLLGGAQGRRASTATPT